MHVAVCGDVCCWENVMNYVTFKTSILLSFTKRFMYVYRMWIYAKVATTQSPILNFIRVNSA